MHVRRSYVTWKIEGQLFGGAMRREGRSGAKECRGSDWAKNNRHKYTSVDEHILEKPGIWYVHSKSLKGSLRNNRRYFTLSMVTTQSFKVATQKQGKFFRFKGMWRLMQLSHLLGCEQLLSRDPMAADWGPHDPMAADWDAALCLPTMIDLNSLKAASGELQCTSLSCYENGT